jgi:hypothetical protein
MLREKPDEYVELECPVCGALVKTKASQAQEGTVHCPRGHEIAVMGMLGGGRNTDRKRNL